MRDIVERLRRAEGAFWAHERRELVTEAASEIERLRAIINDAIAQMDVRNDHAAFEILHGEAR